MTTWTVVPAADDSWSTGEGYVRARYVDDDYVIGYEPSGPWSDVSAVDHTWTEQ